MTMEYMAGDFVRMGFGFDNPNHAAAFLCALLPFCWGWRVRPWLGGILSALLLAALALTFSRTGLVVAAVEWAAWCLMARFGRTASSGGRARRWALAIALAPAFAWWMSPRLVLDGAVANRPGIWLAGLGLFAANPWGVGFGNSGLLASSFLLPAGVEVRTLVNSHLTLLVEMGWPCGFAWLAFVVSALACGRCLPRAWISFGGLALSACASSVFDWHVLFSADGMAGCGWLNRGLSWLLLVCFLSLGLLLLARGFRPLRALCATGGVLVSAAVVSCLWPTGGVPTVSSGCVRYGGPGPTVLHDGGWSLRVIRGYLPDGAVVRIRDGADGPLPGPAGEVWLFGDVAESSGRFPGAAVTVVGAPAFYAPGPNVRSVIREEGWPCR